MNNAKPIPPQDAWEAWHPDELRHRLERVPLPWCVVGGWALDLWHGRQTRAHEDIEFTVLRDDVPAFHGALGMKLFAVADGQLTSVDRVETVADDVFQFWCWDEFAARWRADMMIEPGTGDSWVYKRDPSLTRPRREAVATTEGGIPYLRPACVLLFKAKYQRTKDEDDFRLALPMLETSERRWLHRALDRTHPGHDWLRML